MNPDAIFKLSYGLYVLSARQGDHINGCIVNTIAQITDSPKRAMIAVNKEHKTHDMIMATKKCAVTVLASSTSFYTVQNFGFHTGRMMDKFANIPYKTTEEGLPYLTDHTCAYLVFHITDTVDVDTHTMFIGDLVDGELLSSKDPLTYDFYHRNIKPAPPKTEKKKTGWRCKICGYVYEGEELPSDFICPWCKHGASDFEKIE